MDCFIDEREIEKALEGAAGADAGRVREIIEKAKKLKGLSMEETAVLLQCDEPELVGGMFEAAREVKEELYGKRLVLFAPLYLTNDCVNNCLYCAFRKDNTELERKTLSMDEIRQEVEALEEEGHKRLLLVAGEDTKTADINYLERAIRMVYETKKGRGEIRRVNVNVAPLSVDDFRRLKDCGIGTYQLFQETYHRQTYKKMHPSGPKADYLWRLGVMDRAMEAGIDDVGIGVLFGLHDHRFEVLALLKHSMHLEENFGVGPHTISVPRIEPALNAPAALKPPWPVSDGEFRKIVAVIRLAVPYTGIILSTRESAQIRDELFGLGVSQISAGSRTSPGAYGEGSGEAAREKESRGVAGGKTVQAVVKGKAGQFELSDTRSQAEVVRDIADKGLYPSFCTACYRQKRTGKEFMGITKQGQIKNYCLPNSILTYKEYLLDYGDRALREKGEAIIRQQLSEIGDTGLREKTEKRIKRIEKGERDLYF